ncbi:MAG: GntR family transcriptional regulator [Acholeplasmataceae bacterium]
METKSHIARYENIAYQIAKQINDGKLPLNQKLSGRTLLSSEYNVSSETIRRAIRSLVNYGVVDVKEQSGIYVKSIEQAKSFMDDFNLKQQQKNIKIELIELLEEENKIHSRLDKTMKRLLNSKEFFPFDYFTIEINQNMKHIGKTIDELDFYQVTGGLIIAFELDHVLYQIPKPSTMLKEDMILYIMGDLTIKKNILKFFEK